MAIDNAEKRRSAASVLFVGWLPGVTPNASKDAEWRQQAAWSYSGISATPPAVAAPERGETLYGSRIGKMAATSRIEKFISRRVTKYNGD